MKIFLSFSGEQGLLVAKILNNWLPSVINAAQPWLSHDIRKGDHWPQALNRELQTSHCGIVCLTPDAERAPWVLFEAGALSQKFSPENSAASGGVLTFLVNRGPTDHMGPPLSHFQATRFSVDDTGREEMRKMMRALVEFVVAAKEPPPPASALAENFDNIWWPLLMEFFRSAKLVPAPKSSGRSRASRPAGGDGLSEMLSSTARLAKKSNSAGGDYTSVIANALNILAIPETNRRADPRRRKALKDLATLRKPNDRAVTILTGRLHRALQDVQTANDFLTVVLKRRSRRKKKGRDEADFHYNRACYRNLLAERTAAGALRESWRERAWADLREAVKLWPLNLEEARVDKDLDSLEGPDRRFDDLSGPGKEGG